MKLIRVWKQVVVALLAFHAGGAFAQSDGERASPLDGSLQVNTRFGAYGTDGKNYEDQYIAGQLHPGVDLQAGTNTPVRAPVSGKIVYYHRRTSALHPTRWLQTFIVLRGVDGRDYILAHVDCSVCTVKSADGKAYTPEIGDDGVYPQKDPVTVDAGDIIGFVGDLTKEASDNNYAKGVGSHLHLGVVEGHIVDENGSLLAEYHGGKWGSLKFDLATAQASMLELAFVDPMPLLPAPVARPVQAYADSFISNETVSVTVKAAARLRDKPTTEGSTILSTAAAGTRLSGKWVKGVDASARWLKVDAGGYVWDGSLINSNITLGPNLPEFNTKTIRSTQIWQYDLGKVVIQYTIPSRNEFKIWRVERDPYGAGLICRISAWDTTREWWGACANFSPPAGGWEGVTMAGEATSYTPPLENSYFPEGYIQAYRNYVGMLPLQIKNEPVFKFEYTNISPPRLIWLNGRRVTLLSGCEPHNCDVNGMDIFLEQDRVNVRAIVTRNGRKIFLGGAGVAEARCMRIMMASGFEADRC